jgi:hypothetical protein
VSNCKFYVYLNPKAPQHVSRAASAITASRQLPVQRQPPTADSNSAGEITPSGALRSPDHCLVGSVPQSKRDDDIGRLGLVQLQTRPAVVAPAGQIHDHAGLLCLDRLHDVEPVAVEKESVLAEQVVELRNHRMVVGNGLGLPKVRSSCAELSFIARSFRSLQSDARYCALRGLPHDRQMRTAVVKMRSSVIPRGLRKLFSRVVK